MKTMPNTRMVLLAVPEPATRATSDRSSEPVAPYSIEIPYNRKPDDSAPRMKYFIAASVDTAWSRRIATSAYSDSDINSRPR